MTWILGDLDAMRLVYCETWMLQDLDAMRLGYNKTWILLYNNDIILYFYIGKKGCPHIRIRGF